MSDGLVKKNFLIVENKNIQKLSFREIKDLKILLPQLNINTVNLQTWPGPDLNDSTWDLRDARSQTSRAVHTKRRLSMLKTISLDSKNKTWPRLTAIYWWLIITSLEKSSQAISGNMKSKIEVEFHKQTNLFHSNNQTKFTLVLLSFL